MSERNKPQEVQNGFDLEMVHRVLKETGDFILALEGTTAGHVIVKLGELQIEVTRADGVVVNNMPPVTQMRGMQQPNQTPLAAKPGSVEVLAPLVGVFYHASAPGAKPFVAVGDTVEPGQKVGIIEAMKVMNEVICDHRGVVTEILVPNGEAVLYEQPLILIDVFQSPTGT
jgi:acetyl-CoA carboxylase biotin carboxyl carrier protein